MAKSSSAYITRFEFLSGENYHVWKMQVEALLLLIRNDTWTFVSDEKTKLTIPLGADATATDTAQASIN